MTTQQYQIGYLKGKTDGMVEGLFKMQEIINIKLKTEHGLKFVSTSKKEIKHFVKTGKWLKPSSLTGNSSEVKNVI